MWAKTHIINEIVIFEHVMYPENGSHLFWDPFCAQIQKEHMLLQYAK